MTAQQIKSHILENELIETILEELGCHHIKKHGDYYTAGNKDGNNPSAIVVYDNEVLTTINYTRQLTKTARATDIFDLVAFCEQCTFPEALKWVCNTLGLDYYNEPEDRPESLQILDLLRSMASGESDEDRIPLKPIDEKILDYYLPYGNEMFYNDGISYEVQKEFMTGYDPHSNRITIPIRSPIGDLCGVKGRWLGEPDEYHPKYIYIEPTVKSKILYGLYENREYIKESNILYCFEAEKSVQQAASYGYRNTVATGGKSVSKTQMELLIRTGARICLALDKDVQEEELKTIASVFPDNIPIYAIIDKDNILQEKESPSDNINNWMHLIQNNIYQIK